MRAVFPGCAALFAASVLVACQSAPRAASPGPAAESTIDSAAPADARATRPALAPPGAVGTRSASQVIHAIYGARSVVMRTGIETGPEKLDVVGVTATGQRVFTAHYDGRTI